MVGFILYFYQVVSDIYIEEVVGLIEVYGMIVDIVGIEGFVYGFQIIIGDGVLVGRLVGMNFFMVILIYSFVYKWVCVVLLGFVYFDVFQIFCFYCCIVSFVLGCQLWCIYDGIGYGQNVMLLVGNVFGVYIQYQVFKVYVM